MSTDFEQSACKLATRLYGNRADLALNISDQLRDYARALPILDKDDRESFNLWVDEEVPNGPRGRAEVHAAHIEREWAGAVGEPSGTQSRIDVSKRLAEFTADPQKAAASMTGAYGNGNMAGILGQGPSGLSGDLAKVQQKIMQAKRKDESADVSELEAQAEDIQAAIDSRSTLAMIVALAGEVEVPERYLELLNDLPEANRHFF